jgi:Cu+-exporting ATPase
MTPTTTTDPVCGMPVEPASAIGVEYADDVYYFCESVCADTFRDEPARWVQQAVTLEG